MLTYRTIADFDDQLLKRFIISAVKLSTPKPAEADVDRIAERTRRRLSRLAADLGQVHTDITLQDFWKLTDRKHVRWLHALVSVPGSALAGLIGAEVADGTAGWIFALSYMSIGIGFGTWAAVDPNPLPSRINFRSLRNWRYSVPVLAFGFAMGAWTVHTSGWAVGFTIWLLTTLIGSIFVGLRRGMVDVARPGDPLKNDLTFGIAFGLATGAWAGLPTGFTGGLVTDLEIKRTLGLWPSVLLAFMLGIIGGVSVGSRAWLRYVVALAPEAVLGRLPWRLHSFLEWAYGAGLLRISGLAYQFRHDKLKVWLASNYDDS